MLIACNAVDNCGGGGTFLLSTLEPVLLGYFGCMPVETNCRRRMKLNKSMSNTGGVTQCLFDLVCCKRLFPAASSIFQSTPWPDCA